MITRIEIEDFRCIKHLKLDPVPSCLVLAGRNGQGKSSVLDAVRMAMFGYCGRTGKTGQNARDQIRLGAGEARIAVAFGDLIAVAVIKQKGNEFMVMNMDGEIMQDIMDRAAMWRTLGVSMENAAVAAMPDMVLTGGEFGDILTRRLAPKITSELVKNHAGDNWTWLSEFAAKQRITFTSLANLASLGDLAYARRTDVNRELKSARKRIEDMGDVFAPKSKTGQDLAISDTDRIKADVARLMRERESLLEERGRVAAVTPQVDVTALRKELDNLVARLGEIGDEIGGLAEDKELSERYGDVSRIQGEIEAATNQLTFFKQGVCPTCGRKMTKSDDRVTALAEKLSSAQGALGLATTARETAHDEVQRRRVLEGEFHDVQGRIKIVNHQLDQTNNAGGSQRPLAEIDADLLAKAETVARGQAILRDLARLTEKTDLDDFVHSLESEVAHLDWAVEQFRNGALAKFLIRDMATPFLERCNVALSAVGKSIELVIDGKRVYVMLRLNETDAFPFEMCSRGEQMLAKAVIAADFGADSFVLLDDLNDLDFENRDNIVKALQSCPSLICAVADQNDSLNLGETVFLNDGEITEF